jgi:hypothetical protein
MDLQVNEVLHTHGLNAKIIAYVKDESNNPSIMTIALTYNIIFYEVLGLIKPFIQSSWGIPFQNVSNMQQIIPKFLLV